MEKRDILWLDIDNTLYSERKVSVAMGQKILGNFG